LAAAEGRDQRPKRKHAYHLASAETRFLWDQGLHAQFDAALLKVEEPVERTLPGLDAGELEHENKHAVIAVGMLRIGQDVVQRAQVRRVDRQRRRAPFGAVDHEADRTVRRRNDFHLDRRLLNVDHVARTAPRRDRLRHDACSDVDHDVALQEEPEKVLEIRRELLDEVDADRARRRDARGKAAGRLHAAQFRRDLLGGDAPGFSLLGAIDLFHVVCDFRRLDPLVDVGHHLVGDPDVRQETDAFVEGFLG